MKHTPLWGAEVARLAKPPGALGSPRALWCLIVAATALRLVLAAWLGPGNDEAYHDLFVAHLDWSYFDHPPMLALVAAVGRVLLGAHAPVFGLRLGFVTLSAVSTWLMARMTARLYGPTAGWIAAFVWNTTAYYGVAAATFALPDGPLAFFWLLTLDRLLVALREPERVGAWAWVGLAWGGAMLSKYQAGFLPMATLAYLALEPAARPWLRRPGPYVAFVTGLAAFTPVIVWNVNHEWASFAFQGGRALGWTVIRPDRFAVSLGAQAAYLLPWIWVPLVVVLIRELRGLPRHAGNDARVRAQYKPEAQASESQAASRFLLYQAVMPLLAFGALALVQPLLPHWSLVGFLAVFPLLGRAWAKTNATMPLRVALRLSALGTLTVVLTAIVVTHTATGLLQRGGRSGLGLVPVAIDPTLDAYGWDQVGRELQRRGLLDRSELFLFSDRWYYCGHLALATDHRIAVVCYNRHHAQNFAYWSHPCDWVGRDGIFVGVNDSVPVVADLARWFRRFEPLGDFPVLRNGVCIRTVHLYRGVEQVRPFPFGNTRKTTPLIVGRVKRTIDFAAEQLVRFTHPIGGRETCPEFDWIHCGPSDKIRPRNLPSIEIPQGCTQGRLQRMKRTIGGHPRTIGRLDLAVEGLEERFLLSTGAISTRGAGLPVPAAEIAGKDPAPDFPEDEPASSANSSAADRGDRLLEADDLVIAIANASASARPAATSSAPSTATELSNPVLVIVGVRQDLDNGAAAASDGAGAPGALVPAPITHQGLLTLAGLPGGGRPPGTLRADEDADRWPALDLSAATRVRPFESAARGLDALGISLSADRPRPGSEAIAPPRRSGLMSEALPLLQGTLERAFDRFLSRIKDPGGAGASGTTESSDRWIPWLVLTITAGAGALGRWRRWGMDGGEAPGMPGAEARLGRHGLPGLPSAR
jgi:4-amino-4-deoxy-L-arabinose transferase-like glycosyltransferase